MEGYASTRGGFQKVARFWPTCFVSLASPIWWCHYSSFPSYPILTIYIVARGERWDPRHMFQGSVSCLCPLATDKATALYQTKESESMSPKVGTLPSPIFFMLLNSESIHV